MNKKEVRIENWDMITIGGVNLALYGEVYNHENFADGTSVTTSRIEREDLENGIIETKNTIYLLGKKA